MPNGTMTIFNDKGFGKNNIDISDDEVRIQLQTLSELKVTKTT